MTDNKQKIKEFFEEQGFIVYNEEDCIELEKWTDGGVDMIITLDAFTKDSFIKWVNDFNIDEEIEMHRQDDSYKSAFTVRQSLNDFTSFHKHLKKVCTKLKSL